MSFNLNMTAGLNDNTHMKEISISDTKGILGFPLSHMYV